MEEKAPVKRFSKKRPVERFAHSANKKLMQSTIKISTVWRNTFPKAVKSFPAEWAVRAQRTNVFLLRLSSVQESPRFSPSKASKPKML